MGQGGKPGGSVTVGYRYYMAIMMGLCRGPIDEIREIKVGDKEAFPLGEPTITATGGYSILAPELFGGDKKEGGVAGSFTFLSGASDQIAPQWWKDMMTGDVPDFRGVATCMFDGLICSLNPYPKKWKFRLRRVYQGWDGPVWHPELAGLELSGGIRAMNPAHILYECATNRDWGRGLARSRINDAAWLEAAQTLYDEQFGLCIRWNRQETLQDFVQVVLNHIGGSIYTDRESGLLTLRLMRDDYDPETLPLFDYNSGLLSVDSGETAARDNAVNEVIVKYHTPIVDEDREVRAQNVASIQTLGSVNSTTADYSGIPTFELASRVAQRDLRINTTSGRRYKLKLDRRAWRIYPGAAFRISAPDKGIANLILRAGKITDGSLTTGEIQVEAVIDVFGLPTSAFVSQQESQWTPPDTTPLVATIRRFREFTYRDMVLRLSPADLAIVDVHSGILGTMAVKPAPLALNYAIATRTGSDPFVDRGTETFVPAIILSTFVDHYETVFAFDVSYELGLVEIGDVVQIDDEIVRLDAIDIDPDTGEGTITVARGCLDTVPTVHNVGAVAFFVANDLGTDNREYSDGETVDIKILTVTSTATLDKSLAPTNSLLITARQGRPYPPAAVHINTVPCHDVPTVTGSMLIQWVHRDRLLQQDQMVSHFEASIGPEAGTTYNIRVYSASNVLLQTFPNLTDPSLLVPNGLTGVLRFELESERDGITSLQKHSFTVTRTL